MIASRPRATLAASALALALAACTQGGAPLPAGSALEPLPDFPVRAPDEFDRSAHVLATAVLLGDTASAARAAERIDALDADRLAAEEPPSGLAPYAADAENALIEDEIAYRIAQRDLLDRADLDPALARRIEADVSDDPLVLAEARLSDARKGRATRALNAVTRAVGTSFTNPVLLAYRVTMSLLGFGLDTRREDPLSPPERQALEHRKVFVEQHPESPEAAELLAEIEAAQVKWLETQRRRNVRYARRALEVGQPDVARAYAERALRFVPEEPEAVRIRNEAEAELARRWANFVRSLGAAPVPGDAAVQRPLALALLDGPPRIPATAERLAERRPETMQDDAQLALALGAADAGRERVAWRRIERLGEASPAKSNVARHAEAWWTSADENPYHAFRRANRQVDRRQAAQIALGPLASPRDYDLPKGLRWLGFVPALPAAVFGLPARLLKAPFEPADRRVPALLARRYLERLPSGQEANELRDWLVDYEQGRGNHVGALRVAESAPAPDTRLIEKLRESAAAQALEMAEKERRIEVRVPLMEEVARTFPGTAGAREAGTLARQEIVNASEQRIRVSKGYLLENPSVAGPPGLALRPELLDDDPTNGELHPDGVTLVGSKRIELAFLGPSGRASDGPVLVQERIGEERLARLVAQLEETSQHVARTDRDQRFEPDAQRDLYFERARLGAADEIDPRPEARSSYEYIGLRERYGVVRGRESLLPAEIVLQGSFTDFSLGAFPRFRPPKPTPDQVLYR